MAKFAGFQATLFEFLEQLADNNNRPWFLANKDRYERERWRLRWPSSALSNRG